MTTYGQIIYMVLDELHINSDDAQITEEHIQFLANKYRAFLLKKQYGDSKKEVPESNYQTVCVELQDVLGIAGDDCSKRYLKSTETIPQTLPFGSVRVSTLDYFDGMLTYVTPERMRYVGNNKYLKRFIYATIGPDNHLYLKSSNPAAYYLEKVQLSAIFDDVEEAEGKSCDNTECGEGKCDYLDREFPIEEAFIPIMIELIVKEIGNAIYKPADTTNNAMDNLPNRNTITKAQQE